MKRNLLIIIAAVAMMTSVAGCGAEKESASDNNAAVTVHEVVAPKEIEIVPMQEIIDADVTSAKVQIGNNIVVKLPITLEKLIEMGATVPDDINPVNEVVNANSGKRIELSIENFKFSSYYWNETDNRAQLKDCVVNSTANLGEGDYWENDDYIVLPKGIKVGSSVTELKSAYGEPSAEDLDRMEYQFGKNLFKFDIDLEKQTITKILYDCTGTHCGWLIQ